MPSGPSRTSMSFTIALLPFPVAEWCFLAAKSSPFSFTLPSLFHCRLQLPYPKMSQRDRIFAGTILNGSGRVSTDIAVKGELQY